MASVRKLLHLLSLCIVVGFVPLSLSAQDTDIDSWYRSFDSSSDYPTGWRLDLPEYDLYQGKLRLVGLENMMQKPITAMVSHFVPYAPYMRFRGRVEMAMPGTSTNLTYILLYCYKISDKTMHYVALRLGGLERSVSLVLCHLVPPADQLSAAIEDDRVLLRAQERLLDVLDSDLHYEVLMDGDKGWLVRLWIGHKPSSVPSYQGRSSFLQVSPDVSGDFGILCQYTKNRRKTISFDDLSVEASMHPIAPFDINPTDPTDPTDPIRPVDPVAPQPDLLPQIVVNELMARPSSIGGEYIELYNRSEMSVPLNELAVALLRDGMVSSYTPIRSSYILPPKSFVVLTKSVSAVRAAFPSAPTNALVELVSLPRLADAGFTLVLFVHGANAQPIDTAIYDTSRFEKGIKSKAGYALERISVNVSGILPSNWLSAHKSVRGTPAQVNSRANDGTNVDPSQGDPNTPNEHDEGVSPTKKIAKRNYSPTELAQIAIKHMKVTDNRCASFLYTISGNVIAMLNANETLKLCKQITQNGALDLSHVFGLAPGKDYLWTLHMQSVESGRSVRTSIFRVYR